MVETMGWPPSDWAGRVVTTAEELATASTELTAVPEATGTPPETVAVT